jgi:hypothetical protein
MVEMVWRVYLFLYFLTICISSSVNCLFILTACFHWAVFLSVLFQAFNPCGIVGCAWGLRRKPHVTISKWMVMEATVPSSISGKSLPSEVLFGSFLDFLAFRWCWTLVSAHAGTRWALLLDLGRPQLTGLTSTRTSGPISPSPHPPTLALTLSRITLEMSYGLRDHYTNGGG